MSLIHLDLPASPPLPRSSRPHSPQVPSSPSPRTFPDLSTASTEPTSPPSSSSSLLLPDNDISLLPLFPLSHHLAPFLLPSSPLSPSAKRDLFTSNFLRSASSGHSDTLEWLLSIPDAPDSAALRRFSKSSLSALERAGGEEGIPDIAPRKWVELERRDEDGNSALGLSVALGHAEGVRLLVEAGASVTGGDRAGWTPLHWAVQNNDIPIAAYLLNHRASPTLASHKGLTPRDLVKRGREGAAMREVLKSAEEAIAEREGEKGKGMDERPGSRMSLVSTASSSRPGWAEVPDMVEEAAREWEMKERIVMAMESAWNLEVDLHVLGLGGRTPNGGVERHEDDEEQGIPNPFIWDRCLPDQMLVFSLQDLPVIFDVVITNMKPVRARLYRVIPANVVFLSARFAHYFGSTEMLEELFLGAIERIEAAVHARPDDMANCAFWISNSLLLLYYLRKEPNLFKSTSEYQVHLADLINEIFVFVLRDVERRIDRVLEPAVLEYESLPGFEDVQFEGDWSSSRFVKKLTGRGKKAIPRSSSARSIFDSPEAGMNLAAAAASPPRASPYPQEPSSNVVTPRAVTSLLSSTLFILQIYEIPPAIVVQAFSQLFYWISCEIFNRMLTQKKYLCRSRATQIRLNASSLEEWARQNRLPSKMVSVHFAPVTQMLRWLQCLSSESSIDTLIGTIQTLRSLNPIQLRRAFREYRYEVDEPRMDEDCAQYLAQIQKQWESFRMQKTAEEQRGSGEEVEEGKRSISPTESTMSVQSDIVRMIDEVFKDPGSFGAYTPPGGSETLGELLNSRYMLPFAVPSSAEMLLNFRIKDAFGPFAKTATSSRPSSTPTNSNRNSLLLSDAASSRSTSTAEPAPDEDTRFVPILPDDFFAVLDAAKGGRASGEEGEGREGQGWFDWREAMPEDEESEEEDVEVDATPRPPTGFARN